MLSLDFGLFLVTWKVGRNEITLRPSWDCRTPLCEQLAGQMFPGLGRVRREQLKAQASPAQPNHRTKRKSLNCTAVTFAKGQDEVYVSLQPHISLS